MARAIERDPAIPQRGVGVVPDHEVVEDVNVEEAPSGQRLGRQVQVVRRWRRVARGVVMDEDDPRGVQPDRVPEQLADADEARAHVALVRRGLPRGRTYDRPEKSDSEFLSRDLTARRGAV